MRTIQLGKTGLKVSRVGIGGIPITRPRENQAIKIIRHALDLGINFIDTSLAYSSSEERIGKAIVHRRDRVIIATKGGWRDKATTWQNIEQSLKRLNIDHIDIWQFHGINSVQYLKHILQSGGPLEAAQEALKAGKIRHIGFSSHNLDAASEAISSGHFETVQFPLNFVSNEATDKLVPLAKEYGLGYIAMKPFAGGRIRKAKLAIKYLLQFDNVLPDPGIERTAEIDEIVDIVNGDWRLSPQELQEIENIRKRVGKRFCHQCEYCMPCPQGVFIPGMMYLQILWELWSPEWFLSWSYVKDSVESYKKCIQCGTCETKCPYLLPIREMMVENSKFYENVSNKKLSVKRCETL